MKRTKSEKIILAIAFVVFVIYSITLVVPLVWMILNSFKTHSEFFQNVWGLPKKFMFSNYVEALNVKVEDFTFIDVIINSVLYSIMATVVTIFFPTVSAYVCSKYNFKLRGVCIYITLILLAVPVVGGSAATLKLFKAVNIYNKWYWSLIISSSAGFGGNYLLIRSALDNTSWTYAEAGFIDGASDWQVMFKIMLPMVKPIIIILAIMGFISTWNDYMGVWLYAPSYPTIGVALKQLSDNLGKTDPVFFALMTISLIPVMILFISFQKTIMNNFALGGIKG